MSSLGLSPVITSMARRIITGTFGALRERVQEGVNDLRDRERERERERESLVIC